MHVKSLNIPHYKGFKGLEVEFQAPDDNGNALNVLIGKNGSGKTTVLELIANWFTVVDRRTEFGEIDLRAAPEFDVLDRVASGLQSRKYTTNLQNEIASIVAGDSPPYKYPQFIYLPALIRFRGNSKANADSLGLDYRFSTTLQDDLLGKTAAYIKEYIISAERSINLSDAMLRASQAVEQFNRQFESVDLATKLLKLDQNKFNTPVFCNREGEEVGIDELSDGEKQIYGRLIGLMMLQPKNSVILIDEPEIALHPSWQYKIMELYRSVGTGNQFIVATHSAQILASVPWTCVQVLERQKTKTVALPLPGPPTGVDSSSMLSEIMGAPLQHPDLLMWQNEYKVYFDKKQEDSSEALKLRDKLLAIESEHSSFWQELKFLKSIRDDD